MASQDSVLLNALLCSASAELYANTDNITHKIASIYFKRQAIQYLDQVIRSLGEETVHISTAFSVSLLLWTEVSSPRHFISVLFMLTSHSEFAGQCAGYADTPERAAAINDDN